MVAVMLLAIGIKSIAATIVPVVIARMMDFGLILFSMTNANSKGKHNIDDGQMKQDIMASAAEKQVFRSTINLQARRMDAMASISTRTCRMLWMKSGSVTAIAAMIATVVLLYRFELRKNEVNASAVNASPNQGIRRTAMAPPILNAKS